jgi:hypothetical protein
MPQSASINPQFITGLQHIVQEHRPERPSCKGNECPINDPGFFQQCHFRTPSPMTRTSIFGDISLDEMEQLTRAPMLGSECGVRLEDSQAYLQHFWHDHLHQMPLLPAAALQTESTTPAQSSVPTTPVSNLHEASFGGSAFPSHHSSHADPQRFNFAASSQHTQNQGLVGPLHPPAPSATLVTSQIGVQEQYAAIGMSRTSSQTSQQSPNTLGSIPMSRDGSRASLHSLASPVTSQSPSSQELIQLSHTCAWSELGTCNKTFGTAELLHEHAIKDHAQSVAKDATDGRFYCQWSNCKRRDKGSKAGFESRSKLERHMQTHTQSKMS